VRSSGCICSLTIWASAENAGSSAPPGSHSCSAAAGATASSASAISTNLHWRRSSTARPAHQRPRQKRARACAQPRGETGRKKCLVPKSRATAHIHFETECAASVPGASAISAAPNDPLVRGENLRQRQHALTRRRRRRRSRRRRW
jgi:hypothetical protein